VRNRYSPNPNVNTSNFTEKECDRRVKVNLPSHTDLGGRKYDSESDSEEEYEVIISKPAVSTKTGPPPIDDNFTKMAASGDSSTPKSRRHPPTPCSGNDQPEVRNPEFNSPSPVRPSPSPTAVSERELSDNSTAFFTPATTKISRRQSMSSTDAGDRTIQPSSTFLQDLDDSGSNSTASLSPVNFENCSPPEKERRYNTRRAAERRKPKRLGYESVSKLSIVNEMLQLLREQL
jgi:hypothetical protein